MARKIGYLRVSTQDQRPDRQILGLQGICDELHVERLSAVARKRPVFEGVLAKLKRGDTLVVLDLDRAFRSALDAISTAENLQSRGIEFQIVNLRIDTTTPMGKCVFTVLSAVAELDRLMIGQRTREGLAAARRRGKRLGRPPKLSDKDVRRARRRIEKDEKLADIAPDFNVSPTTLSRALKGRNQAII